MRLFVLMHSMREGPVEALVSFVVVVVDVFKQMAYASSFLKVKTISEYLIMEIYAEFRFTKITCTLHRHLPTWSESPQLRQWLKSDFLLSISAHSKTSLRRLPEDRPSVRTDVR